MRSLIAILVVLLLSLSYPLFLFADSFEYSYRDPCPEFDSEYIIEKKNIECRQEGSVSYWKPEIGGSTKSTTEPGILVYHFNLPRPIDYGWLKVNTATYHWWYSQGHSYIYYSIDGTDWKKLAEAPPPPPPPPGSANYGAWDGSLPSLFSGLNEIYLKVVLYSYGERAASGGAFTNTAQHSRFQAGTYSPSFRVTVTYEDWIKEIVQLKSIYYSSDGEQKSTDRLVPGVPSEVITEIRNPRSDSDISIYLTIGLSLNGNPPVTIGQSGRVIKAKTTSNVHTEITTPANAKGHESGELVLVLKEVGTDNILDIYKKRWTLANTLHQHLNSLDAINFLLLLHVVSQGE